MSGSDRPHFSEVRTTNGRHLPDEELNRYLDGDLAPAEMSRSTAHLVTCESCRARLTDLRIVAQIVSQLPLASVPRSFQLGPDHLRIRRSLIDRLGAALIPALPALRAATVAIALTLGGLTAFRVADDQPQSGPSVEQTVRESTSAISTNPVEPAIATSAPTLAATMTPPSIAQKAPPPDESAAGAAAPAEQATDNMQADEAAESSLASTEDQEANPAADTSAADGARTGDETAAADENSVMAMEVASPDPTASPSPSPSPVPIQIEVASPTPTITIAPQQDDGDSWIGNAQWVLGVLLLFTVVLTAGLTIARRISPDRG